MSKQKQQGTRLETRIVKILNEKFGGGARRLPEGGPADLGDVEYFLDGKDELPLIVEAKARQQLNIHQAVAKANSKAGLSRSVVWWKRLTPSKGGRRRSPDGVAEVVAMDYATFLWLLERRGNDVV